MLRKLIAALDGGVQDTYNAAGITFRPRYFPVVQHLLSHGEATVGALALAQGVSQPAASQTLREMTQDGLVELHVSDDRRSRIVRLTPEGRELVGRLEPIWAATETAAARLQEEAGPLGPIVAATLSALDARPFAERIRGEMDG